MKIIISKNLKKDVKFKGTLKQNKDNFVYLDVSNDLINGFYRSMEESAQKTPYDKKSFNNVGAHISVIGTDEFNESEISDIKEIGNDFSFQLKDVKSVNPSSWGEMERVWFIEVESTELEELRKKYGLSKKLDGHEFHITFAVKEK